jgi:hypothetical protein
MESSNSGSIFAQAHLSNFMCEKDPNVRSGKSDADLGMIREAVKLFEHCHIRPKDFDITS